jgi:hypothetical protein
VTGGIPEPAAGTESGRRSLLVEAALLLYPRAWRDRYGEEVRALVQESGGLGAAAASLAWRAGPAWIWPPRHLLDAGARMRSSVSTVLAAWSALTAIGVVFALLTQFQGFRAAGHPVVGWAYLTFDVTLAASVLVAATGGLPLWLQMLGQARRERRRAITAWLVLTVAAPAAYLVAAAFAARVVHHPEASGPWWFVGFAIAGFAVAALACAGPMIALRRLRPDGPAVRRAATAAGIAAAAVAAAGIASGIAATGLCQWARGFAGYHHDGLLSGYLIVITAAAVIAAVSGARGVHATLSGPAVR